jgi:hypothetical protein
MFLVLIITTTTTQRVINTLESNHTTTVSNRKIILFCFMITWKIAVSIHFLCIYFLKLIVINKKVDKISNLIFVVVVVVKRYFFSVKIKS